MSTANSAVSDMMLTVKSREVQRGMLAEMRGDRAGATRHMLAAAHLELVLADDYTQAGLADMAIRSRISAASCLWRAGEVTEARQLLDAVRAEEPARDTEIRDIVAELENADAAP